MTTGALTATYVGQAKVNSAALKALIETVNCGGATEGTSTTTIVFIPLGVSDSVAVWKYVRAA